MLNHKLLLRQTGLARTCLSVFKQPNSMVILCSVCQTVCSKDVSILVTFFPICTSTVDLLNYFFRFYTSTVVNQFPRNFSIIFRVIFDLSVQLFQQEIMPANKINLHNLKNEKIKPCSREIETLNYGIFGSKILNKLQQ